MNISVYHTATRENAKSISQNGLDATFVTHTLLQDDEIATVDNWYVYPQNSQQSLTDYAYSLILTRLETKRPNIFPKHHDCLFFFPSKTQLGELNRPVCFEIDGAAFNDAELYQADFKTAERLFFDTLRDFEIGNEIKKRRLDSLVTDYWNSAEQIKTLTDADNNAEVFSPIQYIDTKYITKLS